MLFKDDYFTRFRDGTAQSLQTFSTNAALSIVVIWDAIRFQFYKVDLGQLVHTLEKELPSSNLPAEIPFQLSESVQTSLSDERQRLLSAHFYHYYLSRLPILFRYNRIIRGRKKRTPSRTEIRSVVRHCVKNFFDSFSDIGYSLTNDEYFRFVHLARWYVRPKVRWDAVYSMEWLWEILRTTYPDILAASNADSITNHVIESSFPMFWDRFTERYLYCMKSYACFGCFVGDKDIHELEAALKESELEQ